MLRKTYWLLAQSLAVAVLGVWLGDLLGGMLQFVFVRGAETYIRSLGFRYNYLFGSRMLATMLEFGPTTVLGLVCPGAGFMFILKKIKAGAAGAPWVLAGAFFMGLMLGWPSSSALIAIVIMVLGCAACVFAAAAMCAGSGASGATGGRAQEATVWVVFVVFCAAAYYFIGLGTALIIFVCGAGLWASMSSAIQRIIDAGMAHGSSAVLGRLYLDMFTVPLPAGGWRTLRNSAWLMALSILPVVPGAWCGMKVGEALPQLGLPYKIVLGCLICLVLMASAFLVWLFLEIIDKTKNSAAGMPVLLGTAFLVGFLVALSPVGEFVEGFKLDKYARDFVFMVVFGPVCLLAVLAIFVGIAKMGVSPVAVLVYFLLSDASYFSVWGVTWFFFCAVCAQALGWFMLQHLEGSIMDGETHAIRAVLEWYRNFCVAPYWRWLMRVRAAG